MRDIVEGSGVGCLSYRIEGCRSTRAQSCYEHNHPELEARLRSRAEAEGLSVEAYVERIARDDERAEQELEALALEKDLTNPEQAVH